MDVALVAHVLVIEDDRDIREAIDDSLSATGHVVRPCGTALDGLRELANKQSDVVILDLHLPDLDGASVLRLIRADSAVPVVVATACGTESEIIRLLRAGADDYVVKPYSVEQLEARIAAVLRRGAGQAATVLTIGGLHLDAEARIASLDGVRLQLSRLEFDLLTYLAQRAGKVVTRRQLLDHVWRSEGRSLETVDVHVTWLRRKLGERASTPRYLHTVRGVGIRLCAPEDAG